MFTYVINTKISLFFSHFQYKLVCSSSYSYIINWLTEYRKAKNIVRTKWVCCELLWVLLQETSKTVVWVTWVSFAQSVSQQGEHLEGLWSKHRGFLLQHRCTENQWPLKFRSSVTLFCTALQHSSIIQHGDTNAKGLLLNWAVLAELSWSQSNRYLHNDSKMHHPKTVITAWHFSPNQDNCDPLRQKFNIEVSQFPRACLDSGPISFLLVKQSLRRLHENSNGLPQNSCKLRMSQDFKRTPHSIKMSKLCAPSRRGEVLTAVILIWFLRASAAPAMGPAGQTVTPPGIHLSGSADNAQAAWPGPRTDHVFCHFRLGNLGVPNLKGSRYHCTAPKQLYEHIFFRSQKGQRTLAQGGRVMVYQIYSLYQG